MSRRLSVVIRKPWFQLFGLGLLALLVRILGGAVFRFDGLYGQDSYAYYDYAEELAGALAAGQRPPPFFWPLGYPLLVDLGSLLTGWRPLAGQSVSVVAGSSLAPLAYLLVLAIRPRATAGALVAGLLAATAGQLTLSSLSIMSDTAGLAWATLSAWAMLRYLRQPGAGWLALAAFSLGWAVITRWVFGLLVLPWAIAALLTWQLLAWPWSSRVKHMGLAVMVGGAILGLQFSLFVDQPGAFTGNLQVVSWSPGNALQRTVTNPDGTFHFQWPMAIFYAQPLLHPSYLFPLLVPFWLLGLAFLWHRRHRLAAQATLILGWIAVVYLFLAGIPWQNWRFPLSFFPPLLVLTGLGFQVAWNRIGQVRAFRAIGRPLLLSWVAISLLGTLVWNMRDLSRFVDWSNDLIAAARWTESRLPPKATVITFGLTQTLDHRTDLSVEEIFSLDRTELAQLVAEEPALYLLLDLDNVASQWVGLSPADNLDWLRQYTSLVELGAWPPYTLFRVDAPVSGS